MNIVCVFEHYRWKGRYIKYQLVFVVVVNNIKSDDNAEMVLSAKFRNGNTFITLCSCTHWFFPVIDILYHTRYLSILLGLKNCLFPVTVRKKIW